MAVDSGGEVLGIAVPKAKVLYLALEDTEYRLSDRLKKLTAGKNIDLAQDGDADFFTEWSPFSEHGLADLRAAFDEGYKLVIIDTFSRVLGRADQMDQQEMTRVMDALQRMAAAHHAALLLVDHHRKSARTSLDSDPIDDILGSTAKAGVVDCALGLYRRHNEGEAKLKLSGRDFGDSELGLEWDANAFCWNLKQPAHAAKGHYTLREQETIDAVGELGEATLSQLVAHTGHNKGSLYTRLQNLCDRGALCQVRGKRGLVYCVQADAPAPIAQPACSPADRHAMAQPSTSAETVEAAEAAEAAEAVEVVEVVEVVEMVEFATSTADSSQPYEPGRSPGTVPHGSTIGVHRP